MPNRILKESIRISRKVNSLSDFNYRVWTYLITYADDFGRGSADPELLKGIVFPRRKGITEGQIEKSLTELANGGMVILYKVDGEPYFYFPNWDKHQTIRAKKSKFPSPDLSDDEPEEPESICKQTQAAESECPRNPIRIRNPNTESESNANRASVKAFVPPTLEEVKEYCKERNSPVDPKKFHEYFTVGEWKDSEGKPVKNWKQKLLTWEKMGNGRSGNYGRSDRRREEHDYEADTEGVL